mmetsp:Transcript_20098/g.60750  ORF Transcript_20098/g.60750 Transcript_20098/m.60750 type:complete len:89 (+) Transcript_20098:670-936(+)
MAAGGYDKKIIIWDVATFDKVRTIEVGDWVECLDWSPDGELLGCGGGFDKQGKIFEADSGARRCGSPRRCLREAFARRVERACSCACC